MNYKAYIDGYIIKEADDNAWWTPLLTGLGGVVRNLDPTYAQQRKEREATELKAKREAFGKSVLSVPIPTSKRDAAIRYYQMLAAGDAGKFYLGPGGSANRKALYDAVTDDGELDVHKIGDLPGALDLYNALKEDSSYGMDSDIYSHMLTRYNRYKRKAADRRASVNQPEPNYNMFQDFMKDTGAILSPAAMRRRYNASTAWAERNKSRTMSRGYGQPEVRASVNSATTAPTTVSPTKYTPEQLRRVQEYSDQWRRSNPGKSLTDFTDWAKKEGRSKVTEMATNDDIYKAWKNTQETLAPSRDTTEFFKGLADSTARRSPRYRARRS